VPETSKDQAASEDRPDADDSAVDVSAMSYVDASRELDRIVTFVEQREVDIDQLVAHLQRATTIVDELDRRLRHTRSQVEELVPRLEAAAFSVDDPESDDAEPQGESGESGESDDSSLF